MRVRSASNQSRTDCCCSSRGFIAAPVAGAAPIIYTVDDCARTGGTAMLIALLVPLGITSLLFTIVLLRAAIAKRSAPSGEAVALGAITNFFDTLGIGSFAPTMAWFKFRNLFPDRLIPSTMQVGHSLPTIAQAVIFL